MTLYDDLLVDGVSLTVGLPAEVQAGACVEGPWQWPYLQSTGRGEFPTYPGYDGAGYTDQPYAAYVLPVNITLSSPPCEDGVPVEQSDETWAWINNAIEQVRLVCKPDRLVTLTRRRSMPGMNDEVHTTRAKLANITTTRDGRDTLRLVVEFTILDGIWYGELESPGLISSTPATYAIRGDTRTYNILLALGGASPSPTILNETNLYRFKYTGNVSGGAAVVDVLARTATNFVGGADVSRNLSWTKAHLFRLDPGDNTVSQDVGATDLGYFPAYL